MFKYAFSIGDDLSTIIRLGKESIECMIIILESIRDVWGHSLRAVSHVSAQDNVVFVPFKSKSVLGCTNTESVNSGGISKNHDLDDTHIRSINFCRRCQ